MSVDAPAAERWFLDRGLPAVLTARGRLRAIWPRSAPVLAAVGVLAFCELAVYLLSGDQRVNVDSVDLTDGERLVLAVLVLAVPAAPAVGWMVARMRSDRAQSVVSSAAVGFAACCDLIQRDPLSLLATCGVVLVVVVVTASGIGSVLGWATRLTWAQLRAVGDLLIGALPVVLLIVLVFFNTYVWIMAATITQPRLWVLLAILVLIAVTFVFSRTLERARPTLRSASASPRHAERLAGTPFDNLPDPPQADPLTRAERWNEIFVLAATQIVQILTVALVPSGIFFVVGLVVLSPELLERWAHGSRPDAEVLGMTVPVPQALVNMTLFLAALTFMYISARVVSDGEYRSRFLDPLIEDLKLTMLARNRYRYAFRTAVTPEAEVEPGPDDQPVSGSC
ncbi:hypothetical protein ACN27E_15260 [Mycobacterium sp. WMMD1722]|uniref:hypothetical protein n=1 Tax=Mycobacterium sp. WMMD1722 TaxID=3404117 RepID=UPI003BF5C2F3